MSGYLLGIPKFMSWDHNGEPLAGGKLYSYDPGTSTPKATYTDSGLTVANTNPIVLDSRGEATVYLNGSTKLVLYDEHDVLVWTWPTAGTDTDTLLMNSVDVKAYGAIGDGTTNDTVAIQAAATAAAGKVLYFSNATEYKITSAITLSANTTVLGDGLTPIHQDTAATSIFTATSGNKFRDIVLTGSDTTAPDYYTAVGAISAPGTKASPLSNLAFENVSISGFEAGIRAPWTSFYVDPMTKISSVGHGIIGSTGTYTPADQNDTVNLDVRIDGARITCTMATLTNSRCISLPFYLGTGYVRTCLLRGGGMAIETVLNSASAVKSPFSVYDNDCDTSISATNGGVVSGNYIDLANAPLGRGQHPTFYQAIETGYTSMVVNNIVKNHTNGVGHIFPGMVISGNTFTDCGDQGGGVGVGLGGVVVYGTNGVFAVNTVFNTTISNNIFNGTKGGVADIYLDWNGIYSLSGFIIDENQSINGDYYFLLSNKITGKVCNNYINNCVTSLNTTDAFGIWANNGSSLEIYNNTFINTVAGGYGMYQGIAAQPTDVVGFNKFVGMRESTNPIYNAVYNLLCSQLNDGAWYNPKKGSFTMDNAASKVISNVWVTATCQIRLEPTNAAAATLMAGTNSLYISAKTAGTSFTVATAGGSSAAGTETFSYEVAD